MTPRYFVGSLKVLLISAFMCAPTVAQELQRTPWGQPNLQGVWDFRTITPMERPANLVGQEFLMDEEAIFSVRPQPLCPVPPAG